MGGRGDGMNYIITFILGMISGATVGVIGLCLLIDRHTAGISWYVKGGYVDESMDSDQ